MDPEVKRKLKGDTKHRGSKQHNREDPKGDPIKDEGMSPPDWIKTYGIEMWEHLAPILIRTNLLTENDVFAFAIMCNEYDIYRKCIDYVRENGETYENGSQTIPNPFLTIKNKAFDNMNRMMGKFGLTPSDRAKIGLHLLDSRPKNPLGDMLNPDLGVKD